VPILIKRAQISQYRRPDALDVTVKSCPAWAKPLAPTWKMVRDGKSGKMSQEVYAELYATILDLVPRETMERLRAFGEKHGGITFTCYCPDGFFCHTHLLMGWLANNWPEDWRLA